jgi:hypothetical protein
MHKWHWLPTDTLAPPLLNPPVSQAVQSVNRQDCRPYSDLLTWLLAGYPVSLIGTADARLYLLEHGRSLRKSSPLKTQLAKLAILVTLFC